MFNHMCRKTYSYLHDKPIADIDPDLRRPHLLSRRFLWPDYQIFEVLASHCIEL